MKHIDLSLEDTCAAGAKIRDSAPTERFIKKKYASDVERCVDELNKARRGLAALNALAPRAKNLKNLDKDLKEVIRSLDEVVVNNPNQYKDFLLESPSLAEHVTNPDFFRSKRYVSPDNSCIFKPIFSLSAVELPKAMYAYYKFSTKIIYLLLEMAHLEYWAVRFYCGLGYVRVALKIWSYLSTGYPLLKEQLDVLHIIITNSALTGLDILKTHGHEDCGCGMQVLLTMKSCVDILGIYARFEKDDNQYVKKNECPLSTTFNNLVTSANTKNSENKVISRQLVLTMLSSLLVTNDELTARRGQESNIKQDVDLDIEEVTKSCEGTDPAFIAYGDQYLIAAKRYIIGCNYSLSSCDGDYAGSHARREEALKYFTEGENVLRKAPHNEESDARNKRLLRLLITARTLLNLRTMVYTMNQLTQDERVHGLITLRNLGQFDLPKEKFLDAFTKENLLSAVVLVHLILGNHISELKSFKGGKYNKRLVAGLQGSKKNADRLFLEEYNSKFCREMISDFVEHWYDDCEPGRERRGFLLQRSRLLLHGLAHLARFKKVIAQVLAGEPVKKKDADKEGPAGGDDREGPTGGDEKEGPTGGDEKEGPTGGDEKEGPTGGGGKKETKGGDESINSSKGGDDTIISSKGGNDTIISSKGGDDTINTSNGGGDDTINSNGGDDDGNGDGGDGGGKKTTAEPKPAPVLVEEFSDRFFKAPRVVERQSLEEIYMHYVGSKVTDRVESTVFLRGTHDWNELKNLAKQHIGNLASAIIHPGEVDPPSAEYPGAMADPLMLMESYELIEDTPMDESEAVNLLVDVANRLDINEVPIDSDELQQD